MNDPVKRSRRYSSPVRRERAAKTRSAVLIAARDAFVRGGYEPTTVAAIAAAAGVSVDTVYASVGRKPDVLLAVIDMALATGDEPLEAEQRAYVREIRALPTGREKLTRYARALAEVMPTAAPLMEALRRAGATDDGCARAWARLSDRRAGNMRLLAAELRSTGDLRPGRSDDEAADVIWSTGGPEYFLLLSSRGWSPARYAALLQRMWCALLLADGR